ncbi:MAG: FKBP-type peptidyl-prolyl cis-trans isomerase [Bacteroidales bacterium]|nr:FKBP-type peptidyl-prolyl cis-trans isomerase [Bacteroidales bacterium]
MTKLSHIIACLVLLSCTFASCHRQPPVVNAPDNGPDITENMANANRFIVESEETQINAYIERRQWKVTQGQTGVRVNEYQPGNGEKLEWEESVVVEYSVEDLSGTKIYGATKDTLTIGRRQPTAGFDAGLLQLRHGSRAHIIVPSNEAYGMVGDGDRIANRKVLVYDVRVE